MQDLKNIVFDLGGVLIDWNPRYLFTEVFENKDELDYFLTEICSSDWNEEQDGGRSLADGTEALIKRFPEYEGQIRLFYQEWHKMLGGEITANVDIFRNLVDHHQYGLFALTNWSAETFPIALERYAFLQDFAGILVSGVEGKRKPFREFYELMLDRYDIQPEETLFIDDNKRNVLAAEKIGLRTIHLPPGADLGKALSQWHVHLDTN
ncbi:MAG: HAD family phosphatase [Saprospiraceae bacterium]|nr:HAD family phosphatase [Saprospiraceae bacterium]